eukprot:2614556-Heterocapsa_arctica.AAC.1
MEEDALDRGEAFGQPMSEKKKIQVNNVIALNNFVTTTTDMKMRIRVEELETVEDFRRCYPHKTVQCNSGKLNWTICKNNKCFICKCLQNSVVNFEINNYKAETINAIGRWSEQNFWKGACAKEKIEYIAYYLATRPSERHILGRYGQSGWRGQKR